MRKNNEDLYQGGGPMEGDWSVAKQKIDRCNVMKRKSNPIVKRTINL